MSEATTMRKKFIIDFDSTFTRIEAFDALADISLEGNAEKKSIKAQISDITDRGMEGKIDFRDSLNLRIRLLNANEGHLETLIKTLKKEISISFKRNKEFFTKYAEDIYIVSNGFKDFIVPIVTEYGIKPENVYANTFKIDDSGYIYGFDKTNVLSSNQGKVAQLKTLQLQGNIYMIGDGYNDYEVKLAGLTNKFYAYTENVERQSILKNADHITPSLDEFLYLNKMNTALSYPKNRINVLLLESIHSIALKLLKHEGYNVEVHAGGLEEDELCEKIKNVSILGIRSKTQVTKKVIDNANRLISIGAFCIGTNQIDLKACEKNGIAVFNAPFSNTRSVVELAISEIIMLLRNLPDKFAQMHLGKWNKSTSNSYEIRGKKLGIVGYGNIGSQLSVLAEALGMDVHYYDQEEKLALGNATKCSSMSELLSKSDVVSLHVDGRESNEHLIGHKEFEMMKFGVIVINLSRGHVIDLEALKVAIESKKVAGVAVDVFPVEPLTNENPFESILKGLPNTLLTPHIGGSTTEAQENIAQFVPSKIVEYINTGSTANCVSFPNLQLPILENAHRLIHIHHNVSGMMAKIDNILAKHKINIVGQYLKTNESIGYVITDIDKKYEKQLINELKGIENTIKFRVLY